MSRLKLVGVCLAAAAVWAFGVRMQLQTQARAAEAIEIARKAQADVEVLTANLRLLGDELVTEEGKTKKFFERAGENIDSMRDNFDKVREDLNQHVMDDQLRRSMEESKRGRKGRSN